MLSDYVVGLDIGTSSIKGVVVENKKGQVNIRSVFKDRSEGIRKGAIVDLPLVSSAVVKVLGEVRKVSKSALKSIYINIGTHQSKAQSSHGVVAVSRADSEIYEDDIERVVKASQAVNLQPNRLVIHNITREFIIDGVPDIANPLGLSGNRLEVHSLIIDAFEPHVKNLIKAVDIAGGRIKGLIFSPLVASRAVLSRSQKDLGVVLIDIGFGTTGFSIYEENKLLGTTIFPVGAGNVTSDLAVGLKVPFDSAEKLKLSYGYALAKDVSLKEMIELKKFSPSSEGVVSRRFVAEIIEARLAEIFEFVNNELKLLGKAGKLAGGVVLTGGGAKLPGITDLAKQELRLSSQIGFVEPGVFLDESGSLQSYLEDPEFINAFGLALWGIDKEGWSAPSNSFYKIKNIVKYFIP